MTDAVRLLMAHLSHLLLPHHPGILEPPLCLALRLNAFETEALQHSSTDTLCVPMESIYSVRCTRVPYTGSEAVCKAGASNLQTADQQTLDESTRKAVLCTTNRCHEDVMALRGPYTQPKISLSSLDEEEAHPIAFHTFSEAQSAPLEASLPARHAHLAVVQGMPVCSAEPLEVTQCSHLASQSYPPDDPIKHGQSSWPSMSLK